MDFNNVHPPKHKEQKWKKQAEEMALQLRSLAAFPEDHSSIPNTHMVHNHLQLQFQGIAPSPGPLGHQA